MICLLALVVFGTLGMFYGTPTFFINDEVVVGPRPFRYFKNMIDGELRK